MSFKNNVSFSLKRFAINGAVLMHLYRSLPQEILVTALRFYRKPAFQDPLRHVPENEHGLCCSFSSVKTNRKGILIASHAKIEIST